MIEVTPAQAQAWLENAGHNRHLAPTSVDAYAFDMLAGKWELNPNAALIFDCAGRLRDGQHRLAAVIKAGVPVRMFVDFNVSDAILLKIDQGRPRTIADAMQIEREDGRARVKVAIAALMFRLERGYNPRNSVALTDAILVNLGAEHVERLSAFSRIRMPAPATTALVFARPLNPVIIDSLAERINRREFSPGLMNAVSRALGDSRRVSFERVQTAMRVMRAARALIEDEDLDRLEANEKTSYVWVKQERRKLGLLDTVVPASYAMRKRATK